VSAALPAELVDRRIEQGGLLGEVVLRGSVAQPLGQVVAGDHLERSTVLLRGELGWAGAVITDEPMVDIGIPESLAGAEAIVPRLAAADAAPG